jgi:hypothetical protein
MDYGAPFLKKWTMELAKIPLGFALESAARCKIPHGMVEPESSNFIYMTGCLCFL